MTTLLIILLGTMLIQGSAIAVERQTTPNTARGVFADEFRTASFTLITVTLASLLGFIVTHVVLRPLQLDYLQMPALLCGITLIFLGARGLLTHVSGAVRWPDLLAHITTQCAMLGLALFSAAAVESAGESLLYGLGAAFTLAVLSASFLALRERIDAADVPMVFRGIPVALITAGFMALALMGFAGMVRN
jgi:H+/Na+-translocating ferredoxin:NAD+ oxidoreductase subunit A